MPNSRTIIRRCISIVLVVGLILTSASYAAAQDAFWPQFHGPNRDNHSAETGLLKKWPAGGPELLWTAKGLGQGYSSVSMAAGRIYTAGNIGKDTVITALNMDGEVLWQVKNGKAWTRDHPGTRGTPTIDGDRLYHQSPIGSLICLNAETGKKLWQLNTLEKFGSRTSTWALGESVLIDGDNLICCPGGPQTCIAALNKMTGSVVWTAPSTNDLAGYGSAILIECRGLRVVATLTAKAFIGVNADTGELLWRVKHESFMDENISVPIYRDGQVFISTRRGGSVKWKLNVEGGRASLQELWRSHELDNHHGGVILFNADLYGTSTSHNRNLWVCLDWETGRTKHTEKGVGKGSLTCADGMLYTLGERSVMALVRPGASAYETVSSFKIPEAGKGNSWAHPVVCCGRLYIRHDNFLYAYSIR
jgi:outer membrane protein assembly factor BamB